ncbi:hypothetical protein F441_21508 [Phytophthora nicotianae CJ01A1]|uniref:Uncharacterized protein n=3 Tax=Phytophthora nicotianae TaxID=4792 RepID=W2Y3S1_PHYNI|nr:hypothetical protein F441_21508 [Phytophthora nicotianae CJ01A1]ETP29377.1 hypothetical protein F442_21463 [Phytophthora nicotianae P10297]
MLRQVSNGSKVHPTSRVDADDSRVNSTMLSNDRSVVLKTLIRRRADRKKIEERLVSTQNVTTGEIADEERRVKGRVARNEG